jgi:alpha-D-ribose 1-methylphosphonate 5-triphosphate synthase subunit PhnI
VYTRGYLGSLPNFGGVRVGHHFPHCIESEALSIDPVNVGHNAQTDNKQIKQILWSYDKVIAFTNGNGYFPFYVNLFFLLSWAKLE